MNAEGDFTTWEAAVTWLRTQPDQQDLVRAAYYDDPLVDAAERYRASDEWREIKSRIAGYDGAALEIGAGRGIASYALAKEGFRVTALEPDASALVGADAIRSLARDAQIPISVVQEFSERLPFPEASFDLVFARAVLHHTKDLGGACREAYRVLKPGGIFVAAREHVISRPSDLASFLHAHPLHRLYGGEHAFLLSDYTRAIQAAGFEITDLIRPLQNPINYYPHTRDSLREELLVRLPNAPGLREIARRVLSADPVFNGVMRVLQHLDSRPGRLYSFVCNKPRES